MLFRKYPDLIKKSEIITIVKIIIATLVMAVAVRILYMVIGGGAGFGTSIVTCIVCAVAGVLVYGAMLILLKVEDIIKIIPKRR